MFWKHTFARAWRETGFAKLRAVVPSIVTTLSTYGWQWKLRVRTSLHLTLICIGIGLGTYALIVAAEFTLKFFQVIGRDQDSKQTGIEDSIRQLARLLHPDLPAKALAAIEQLEGLIQEADVMFSRRRVSEDEIRDWSDQTSIILGRMIGQGSDWFERFLNGVGEKPDRPTPVRNIPQVLLLRRVAVLRDLIDDIKRQRVLVLAAR
jgi:hypothetical protein